MTPPKLGDYQTSIVTETWVKKKGVLTPRVQYRTTFGGKVITHDSILDLVRALHAEKDGKASALVDVFKDAKKIEAVRKIILVPFGPGDKGSQASDRVRAVIELLEEGA